MEEWRIIFIVTTCIYLFGCTVYWFWSSGELQSWAKNSEKESITKSNTINGVTYTEKAEITL